MRTVTLALGLFFASGTPAAERPPNIILFFTDDQGYADVGCFGAEGFATPHLDQLAAEGMRFTDFYVAQPVCTASRAALLTGCYANRVGLAGALNHKTTVGIHSDEFLLAELCNQKGYATAIFGKWHLGIQPKFLPTRHGFDTFFGIPYSNDNGPLHPILRDIPPLPLFEDEKIIERDPDQSRFTRRITERAVRFITDHQNRPFFLYLPHVMPHVPIFASKGFRGSSKQGLYGDVIQELDASMGTILLTLQKLNLDENTLIIFCSDNGPFLSYGSHAGSARPLRGGKLTTFEGGVRVPCLMRWPGVIPAGTVCAEVASTIDLMPTIAQLLKTRLSNKRKIDGKNILPLMQGEANARSPHQSLFFYAGSELQAVRKGPWKLHLPHDYLEVAGPTRSDGKPANWENLQPRAITQSGIRGIASRHGYKVEKLPLSLYHLGQDIGEQNNLAKQHPEVVAQLLREVETMRADLGDSLVGKPGPNVRPCGRVDH